MLPPPDGSSPQPFWTEQGWRCQLWTHQGWRTALWTEHGWVYPVWTEHGWEQTVWDPRAPHAAVPGDVPGADPERSPYHELLRTPRARRWQLFAGPALVLSLFLGAAVVAYGIAAGLAAAIDNPAIVSDTDIEEFTGPFGLLVTNVMLAALIPACLLTVRVVHGERSRWLNSVTGRLRPRLLATSLVLAAGVHALSLPLYQLLQVGADSSEDAFPGRTSFLALLVVILLTTPLQAAGEEYLFRGYLIQALGVWARSRWVPALLSGLLFAAAHGPQDPWLFTDRFFFGLAAWWLTTRTGGLEAAIAFHVVTNLVALTAAAAVDDLDSAVVIEGIPPAAALLDMATIAVIAWVLDRNARRLAVATHRVVSAT